MSDDGWTLARCRVLADVAEHLAPPQEAPTGADDPDLTPAESAATPILAALGEERFAGQAIFVQALLDELAERSGAGALTPDSPALEAALRDVEAGDDPYLTHGLRLLLGLSLEARYAARTTEPLGARG
ncbi:MAG: hypothetical protein AAFY88_17080 [Acidobacteriota bacterium]